MFRLTWPPPEAHINSADNRTTPEYDSASHGRWLPAFPPSDRSPNLCGRRSVGRRSFRSTDHPVRCVRLERGAVCGTVSPKSCKATGLPPLPLRCLTPLSAAISRDENPSRRRCFSWRTRATILSRLLQATIQAIS
jgi:hypothetical protein